MLLQTHAYTVPAERQDQHDRLVRKMQDSVRRLGGEMEIYRQVGPGFEGDYEGPGARRRFVHVLKFKDRRHQQQVQAAEKVDPVSQQLIGDFCELIDLGGQMQSGQFLAGYYVSLDE